MGKPYIFGFGFGDIKRCTGKEIDAASDLWAYRPDCSEKLSTATDIYALGRLILFVSVRTRMLFFAECDFSSLILRL